MIRKTFSEKKFLGLGAEQQHKKCAELLREAIEQAPAPELLEHYSQLCHWIAFCPLPSSDLESLADRYHAHLQLAGQSLKEDRLLSIYGVDLEEPLEPPIDVTIYLDGLRLAHNIGSIIRSAECFGFKRIVLSPGTIGLSSNQVRRASMGCDQWVEIVEDGCLEDCPKPWIALETNQEATPLDQFSFDSPFTLVLGNEEYGCSKQLLDLCDCHIRIPMHGRKNSLNVAAAFACAAYQVRSQLRR